MKDKVQQLHQEIESLKKKLSAAQRKLKNHEQSEKTYRILFDEAPVGYHELDSKGIIRRVNRTESEMLGYVPEEMIGKPIFEFIHEKHRAVARQYFTEKVKNWRPLGGFQRKYLSKSGQEIDVYITERMIYDENLKISSVRSTIQKISTPTDNAGYHEVDPQGVIININEAEAKFLGYQRKDLIGKSVFVLIKPSEREIARKAFNEKISHWVPTSGFDRQYQRKNGECVDVMIVDRPVYDEKNVVVGIRSTVQENISIKMVQIERDKLINELTEALRKIRTLNGLVPICASCKKIRDDQGYWNDVESYVAEHSEAEFSHGICPDCMKKLYPEEYERILKKKG